MFHSCAWIINPFPYAELYPDGPGLLLYKNALLTALIKGCGTHLQPSLIDLMEKREQQCHSWHRKKRAKAAQEQVGVGTTSI